jgi:hypothetical protein
MLIITNYKIEFAKSNIYLVLIETQILKDVEIIC